MQEIFILITILCFVNEGAPFTAHREEKQHRNMGQVQSISVDEGSNLTLHCGSGNDPVMWIRDGRQLSFARNPQIREDGSLFFPSLHQSDSGLYTCRLDDDDLTEPNSQQTETPFLIRVRTPPLGLNATVTPSTIYALVMWEISDDGGYPVSGFQIRYRLKNETDNDWTSCQPNPIHPTRRQFQIYHLQPNSAYLVEMWANNILGKGISSFLDAATHNDMQEIELGKHLLEGVDTFDTRAWIVAVAVVMGTLCLLGVATCCLFYKEYTMTWSDSRDGDESIELLPNIILNPMQYDFQSMELVEPDENSNDAVAMRINNNSVIYPARV